MSVIDAKKNTIRLSHDYRNVWLSIPIHIPEAMS